MLVSKNDTIKIDLHFTNGLHAKTDDYDKFGLPNTLYIINEDKDKTIKCNIDLIYSDNLRNFFEAFKQLEAMNSVEAISLLVLSDFYFMHKEYMSKYYNCKSIIDVINAVANYDMIYKSQFKKWEYLVDYIVSSEYCKNISECIDKDRLMNILQKNDGINLNINNKSLYYFLDRSVDINQIYCINLKRLYSSQE